jgi:nucleoside-diphosphate-sugar epimerase
VPSDESSPFNPGDEYQRTKLLGEQRVWELAPRLGLAFTIVRPAGIYGPGDLRFLKLFRAIQRGYFVMLGSGETRYHFVYIEDLIDGFLRCARDPGALSQAFLIGYRESITLNDLVERIAELLRVRPPRWRLPVWPAYAAGALCEAVCVPLGITPPLYRRRVDFFTHDRAFDISKARRLLGYEPRVGLTDGLQRTAAWYVTHGYLRNGWRAAPTP